MRLASHFYLASRINTACLLGVCALLWDVELNPEEQAGFEAAELPKPPYAYQADE